MSTHSGTNVGGTSSGLDTAAIVLLALSFAGAILELFYKPFLVALPLLVITMVAIRLSDRYRRIGIYAVFAIVLGFMIGASFAVWDSSSIL